MNSLLFSIGFIAVALVADPAPIQAPLACVRAVEPTIEIRQNSICIDGSMKVWRLETGELCYANEFFRDHPEEVIRELLAATAPLTP